MESNKYNIENFERFLREKTDEFRMYPSKRVWYSIYNSMHPGNRLPSVSMSIILVGFLFLVGYLNTTDTNYKTSASGQNNKVSLQSAAFHTPEETAQLSITALQEKNNTAITRGNSSFAPKLVNARISSNQNLQSTLLLTKTAKAPTTLKAAPAIVNVVINNSIAEEFKTAEENNLQPNNTVVILPAENTTAAIINNTQPLPENTSGTISMSNIIAGNTKQEVLANTTSPVNIAPATDVNEIAADTKDKNTDATSVKAAVADKNAENLLAITNNEILANNKAWMEDFALHNKPVARKWAGKLGVQAYITPSIVYRKFTNNAAGKRLAGTNFSNSNFDADAVVKHKPSIGLEAGLSLQYDISSRIRLKAGAQVNYTRYNAFAFETNHPIAATLTMNYEDDFLTYEVYRSSNYSNIDGNYSTKLHNETYQFSLPVGVDYKLASLTDNISWYAGATAQPTILLFAKSYVLSSDRRSYVNDASLLNRFNLNAGFETYLSFKASGYTLQLGPQYRSQIFSTNTKLYTVEERLQNFGIKFGITKRL